MTGAPHSRIRIGQFRLGCECDYDEKELIIFSIERRGGAYKADDESTTPPYFARSDDLAR